VEVFGSKRKIRMKRIALFITLVALSVLRSIPVKAQSPGVAEYARESREASRKSAKKQQKLLKKAARKQRKPMKKYAQARRKAAKREYRCAR
jgi:hypothetical protein